jgi:hypothetical protein
MITGATWRRQLSLTCDEKRHPHVHKGVFDRDFERFM